MSKLKVLRDISRMALIGIAILSALNAVMTHTSPENMTQIAAACICFTVAVAGLSLARDEPIS